MYKIRIAGVPVPLKRSRARLCSNKIIMYDDQTREKKDFRKKLLVEMLNDGLQPYLEDDYKKCYYRLFIGFVLPYPKEKKETERIKKNNDICYKKPDLDNLIKFVLDCGNELIWKDDSEIHSIVSNKTYGDEPYTYIEVERHEIV